MKNIISSDYYPSLTWHQFLQTLNWQQEHHNENVNKAFTEAIRRDLSRSDVYFDVAEAIYRSYCNINWGLLNWTWKLALEKFRQEQQKPIHPAQPPAKTQATVVIDDRIHGIQPHNGNGFHARSSCAGTQQRKAASLIGYYA